MNVATKRRGLLSGELPEGYDERTRIVNYRGLVLVTHPDHPALYVQADGELAPISPEAPPTERQKAQEWIEHQRDENLARAQSKVWITPKEWEGRLYGGEAPKDPRAEGNG